MRSKADAPKKPGKAKVSRTAKKATGTKAKATAKAKAKAARKPAPAAAKGVNSVSRADVFVREYLIDLNGRQAAIRAGYSPGSARQTASELLATPEVQESLTKAMVERAKRTGIDADQVLQRYWNIATADASELTELHRACCRYCWGTRNRYQYTPREMEEARAGHDLLQKAAEGKAKPFDERGGIGFNPKKDPNPACPECFGDGEERVFAKDTRDLSPQARQLYAGVKTTQHGLEIKTHDQLSALQQVGRHLGMFKEKVELTGKDGKDLDMGVVVLPPRAKPGEGEVAMKNDPVKAPAPVARKALKITAAE